MNQVDRGLMEPRKDPGSLKEQNVSTENTFYIALSSWKKGTSDSLKEVSRLIPAEAILTGLQKDWR